MKLRMRLVRVSSHHGENNEQSWSYLLVPMRCEENAALWAYKPDAVLELRFLVGVEQHLDATEYDVEITPRA